MQHETGGADLLQAAREALLEEILPGLAGRQRYAALMVANALKMVERELMVSGHLRAADHAVQAFADRADTSDDPAEILCTSLRTGRHDADPLFHRALHARTIQAVAITRPDILTSAELGKS